MTLVFKSYVLGDLWLITSSIFSHSGRFISRTQRSCPSACRGDRGCTPRSCVSACREGRRCTARSCFSPCRAGRGYTSHESSFPFQASIVSLPSRLEYGIAENPLPDACGYRIFATIQYACVASLGSVSRSTTRERSCTKCGALRSHLLFCGQLLLFVLKRKFRRPRKSAIPAPRTPHSHSAVLQLSCVRCDAVRLARGNPRRFRRARLARGECAACGRRRVPEYSPKNGMPSEKKSPQKWVRAPRVARSVGVVWVTPRVFTHRRPSRPNFRADVRQAQPRGRDFPV